MNHEIRRLLSKRKENHDMDDLYIHKQTMQLQKRNKQCAEALKEIELTMAVLKEYEMSRECVTILEYEKKLEKLKNILKD